MGNIPFWSDLTESRKARCSQVVSELAGLAARSTNLEQFAQQAVDLVHRALKFYFVGLYLIDSIQEQEWAVEGQSFCDRERL